MKKTYHGSYHCGRVRFEADIDFDQGTASLDATLHDSRLLRKFPLTGDMALRLSWETNPSFALAVGGLHPAFQPDGESRHIRNGVGTIDRRRAWFVISEEPVSFGRFARFFRDVLGCRDALFLDGTVSSLWDPAAGRRDDGYEFGPIAAVFEREPPRAADRRK